MIYLLDVLVLNTLAPPCGHFLSNGGNLNLSLSQVCLKLPHCSQNFNLIYFELLRKSMDAKVLGYPLTFTLTQNLEVGWRVSKLNGNSPIADGTKAVLLGED